MIFVEVNQSTLEGEIGRLRALVPGSDVMEAFYNGAIYALEWVRDGGVPPSLDAEPRDGPDA